jgi:hypothetical protein
MPKLGILIAGSLYWSDRPHRVRWRKDHLRDGSEISVSVPIRYGRLSSTGSYTMVFAPGSPLGTAKVLECVQPARTLDEVVREAQALWRAESPDGSPRRPSETLASDWGCVVLLANPASTLPPGLFDSWAARVAKEHHHRTMAKCYDRRNYFVQGIAAITDRGALDIAWPLRADMHGPLRSVDLLLATATKPTPDERTGDYPTAERVASAWVKTGDHQYFRENQKHGFHTFQDGEIEAYLHR